MLINGVIASGNKFAVGVTQDLRERDRRNSSAEVPTIASVRSGIHAKGNRTTENRGDRVDACLHLKQRDLVNIERRGIGNAWECRVKAAYRPVIAGSVGFPE